MSIKLMETKDGQRYFLIRVYRGKGLSQYQTRLYWKDTWSEKTAHREALKAEAAFLLKCRSGEVLNREQEREKEKAAQAEAAKLKTVRQYAESIYMPTKTATVAEKTRANYRFFLDRYILPALGDFLLNEVTPAMINKLILDFQKAGYSHSSTMKIYVVLNGIFESAFLDDTIPMNPMLKVKRPMPRKDEKQPDENAKAYSISELQTILKCLENEPLKWRAYVSLMADTGARKGEICGLYWKDVDFAAGTITIRRNLQYTKAAGVYETTTKTGKTRIVDVGEDVLALLSKLRAQQAASCLSKYVFTTDGSIAPMHPTSPTHYFRHFGKRYGIADFHPHKLRHTSASLAIINGADIVSVSQRLGHSNVSTTLKVYSHANEESIRRAGQIVRDALKVQNG